MSDRSRCLSCGHELAWYDLLPLVSWLSTGGHCRYCKARIGRFEPVIELATAAAFVVSYVLWPVSLESQFGLVSLIIWLIAVLFLAILFAYDAKWFLLPDQIIFPLIGLGLAMSALHIATAVSPLMALFSAIGSVVTLSGLYFVLWLFSKGQWVGFGDVKLGLGLALLLADWRLALVGLFMANLIGSLLVLPGMILGKLDRKTHVPFGPLLIMGAGIALLVGERIVHLYLGMVL